MENLQLYDKDSECPKCGDDVITVSYCSSAYPGKICWPHAKGDHIHRQCTNCKHEWLEACLDAEQL